MSILTIFLAILFQLTLEMWQWQKKLPVDFHKHPQIIAVIARMRRDVLDAHTLTPYYEEYDEFAESDEKKTLILETVTEGGGTQVIVWDFSKPGTALRRAYNVGNHTEWKALGVPIDFTVWTEPASGHAQTVYLRAIDKEGRIAIDQVFFPRTTQ